MTDRFECTLQFDAPNPIIRPGERLRLSGDPAYNREYWIVAVTGPERALEWHNLGGAERLVVVYRYHVVATSPYLPE